MNGFVRFKTVTGEDIAFNTSFVVTARPLTEVADVVEGIICYRKRFHVAGVTCLRLCDGQEYEILGTLDEVQATLEGNGPAAPSAVDELNGLADGCEKVNPILAQQLRARAAALRASKETK